ncbi:EAP30 [Ostreococcus tauri]|uniref:EAP30 n=1 Tax=Ostreococcus tauri TaxID=70448 RepID=A0A090M880_OSTTA|nr:EAP30 [Ostreococcus tauri]OUS46819.1 EAP30/Vps36 family-domain-containing protein [Ostreococcus tauri]CEG01358.1 EAP30 [Ostreococcus tauri]|eukprot:XP_003080631.2 EAP30 [Ostreococcus tauri]
MRRRPGVSAIARNAELDSKFRELAIERKAFQDQDDATRLLAFTRALETFAATHRKAISSDAVFRARFHAMCDAIGVDPLASRKSAWAQALGLGEFYVDLSVCAAEACLSSRDADGGVCALDEIVRRVNERRGASVSAVSADDVERAIESLSALGGGWRVKTTTGGDGVGERGRKIVRSVPIELSDDVNEALAVARDASQGCVTASELSLARAWSLARARDALEASVKLGIALVDDQAKDKNFERLYWFPAFRVVSSA